MIGLCGTENSDCHLILLEGVLMRLDFVKVLSLRVGNCVVAKISFDNYGSVFSRRIQGSDTSVTILVIVTILQYSKDNG